MIDPRTTNIIGERVVIVRRASDPARRTPLVRGVVRVVDYQSGVFALLIEAVGETLDASWFSVHDGSLFEVLLTDESIEVVVDRQVSA